jgi:hypothetical protein
MNKLILTIFLVLIIGSVGYAWYMYVQKGEYDVSVIIDNETYYVRNDEIENCLQRADCVAAK